jgi:hypothetical protein
MEWVLLVLVTILIVVLARSFVINAIELKRDVNSRFDDLPARLEKEAVATLDGLLDTKPGEDASE